MRRFRSVGPAFGLLLILAVLATACATTGVGKAIQVADTQNKIVHEAAVQFAMLHLQQRVPDQAYANGKAAYARYAGAQTALAQSIAAWKAVGSVESQAAVTAALQRLGPVVEAYLALVGQFVDIPAISKKLGG